MGNYPPGVTGSEPQVSGWSDWERWADALKPGDPCLAYGTRGVVKVVGEDFVWVLPDRPGAERLPVPWEDLMPVE